MANPVKEAAYLVHERFVEHYGPRWCARAQAEQMKRLAAVETALRDGGITLEDAEAGLPGLLQAPRHQVNPPPLSGLCSALRAGAAARNIGKATLELHHALLDRYGNRWLDTRITPEDTRLARMHELFTDVGMSSAEIDTARRRIYEDPRYDTYPPPLEAIVDHGRRSVDDDLLFRAAVGLCPFPRGANRREIVAFNNCVSRLSEGQLATMAEQNFERMFGREFRRLAHREAEPNMERPRVGHWRGAGVTAEGVRA